MRTFIGDGMPDREEAARKIAADKSNFRMQVRSLSHRRVWYNVGPDFCDCLQFAQNPEQKCQHILALELFANAK